MIALHKAGEEHAKGLISHGKVSDKPFTFDAADRAELLGPKGTDVRSFALHHLGVDDGGDEGDPKSYRYACAKAGMIHSRALKSICERAEENGHDEVRASAEGLIQMIEAGGNSDPPEASEQKSRPATAEVRCLMTGLELRAAPTGSDSPGTVHGFAAVYNMLSEDLGGFREIIRPGAFRDVLGNDVRALANHSSDLLLGRLKSGTLRLKDTPLGLADEIDLPATQAGRDTAISIRRGDMDGQSFAFSVEPEDVEWDWTSTPPTRIIHRFSRVYDVGPVTNPAYVNTTAAMRSLAGARPLAGDAANALDRLWARQQLAEAALAPP